MQNWLFLSIWFCLLVGLQTFECRTDDDDDPSTLDKLNDLSSIISLFRLPEMDGRRMSRMRGDDESGEDFNGDMIECYCSVIVNGGRNHKGEDAICGRNRGRIICPYRGGCQVATANVQGFVSTVRMCGHESQMPGCRMQRQKAQFVGEVQVRRCFCMGRLCNKATTTTTNISHFRMVWTLVSLVFLGMDY